MNLKTALLLSTSEYLTESMQEMLINIDDESILKNLASNRYLSPRLKYRFIGRDRLLNYILNFQQNDLIFLKKALEVCENEQTLIKFTNQQLLDRELITMLIEKASPIVAYYLAGHKNVSIEERIELFKKYFSTMGEINQYSLKDFSEKFGNEPRLWEIILSRIGLSQAIIARGAVELVALGKIDGKFAVDFIDRIEKEVVKRALEDKNWFRGVNESRRLEEVESFAYAIASLTTLKNEDIERIAKYSFLTKSRAKARESLDREIVKKSDLVRSEYLSLIADRGREVGKSREIKDDLKEALKGVVEAGGDFKIPVFESSFLVLFYRSNLDEKLVTNALELARGRISRSLAELLLDLGLKNEFAFLVKRLSTIILDEIDLNQAEIYLLSREGILDYNNKEYIKKYSSDIIESFSPLYLITSEPNLLAKVVSRLEVLDPSTRDTALALLPEWVQDLPSLIKTAERLNIETPKRD